MNIEAVRRVKITVSKAEIVRLLKKDVADIHIQCLPADGKGVEMALGGDTLTFQWFSGPLSKTSTETALAVVADE